MTVDSSFPAPAEPARAAFLRGIEHHGLVLAEAQCGDTGHAKAAVTASKIAFHRQAASEPSTQWSILFWQLLLAQPGLSVEQTPDPRSPFSLLKAGPRAALLLRLVAGLDQVQGAEVLGVPPATYRHALYRALEILRARGIDEAALELVRGSLQRDAKPVHAMAIAPAATEADDGIGPARFNAMANRIRPILIALAALMLLAFAASFVWQPHFLRSGVVSANGFEMLRASEPAATLSPAATVVSGADFDLLNDPQGLRIARDLDLYAWYAATSNVTATGANVAAALPETTLPETAASDAEAEDTPEGASPAADSALPVVTGHPVAGHPKAATPEASHAH